MAEVPYEEVSAHDLDPSLKIYRKGKVLRWACPRCERSCEHDISYGYTYGLIPWRRTRDDNRKITLECVCGCFLNYRVEP